MSVDNSVPMRTEPFAPSFVANVSSIPHPASAPTEGSVTTERLALVGLAAQLSTVESNLQDETRPEEDVREEARLLLGLLSPPRPKKAPSSLFCDEEIGVTPSGSSDELDEGEECHRNVIEGRLGCGSAFRFSCPSLSIERDSCPVAAGEKKSLNGLDAGKAGSIPPKSEEEQVVSARTKRHLVPSTLFERPLTVHDQDSVITVSGTLARNIAKSFGTALRWRVEAWAVQLCEVLALRDDRARKLQQGHVVEELILDNLRRTREAKVVTALLRARDELMVKDVRTDFQVLSQLVNPGDAATLDATRCATAQNCSVSSKQNFITPPPPKQRRLRRDLNRPEFQASPSTQDRSEPEENLPQDWQQRASADRYSVAHKLTFEATLTISTRQEQGEYSKLGGSMTITLRAPGTMEGIFESKSHGVGDGKPVGVNVKLDTDVLALCIERQSRLVARKAAEAALRVEEEFEPALERTEVIQEADDDFMSTPKTSPTLTSYYSNAPSAQCAVVTPKHGQGPFFGEDRQSNGIDAIYDDTYVMPPPPPRMPITPASDGCSQVYDTVTGTWMASPTARRVSPPPSFPRSPGGAASLSMLPTLSLSTPTTPTSSFMKPSLLPFVSPPPSRVRREVTVESQESQPRKGEVPSFPALVEVACAAMSAP